MRDLVVSLAGGCEFAAIAILVNRLATIANNKADFVVEHNLALTEQDRRQSFFFSKFFMVSLRKENC